jgi:hypothetical protein
VGKSFGVVVKYPFFYIVEKECCVIGYTRETLLYLKYYFEGISQNACPILI